MLKLFIHYIIIGTCGLLICGCNTTEKYEDRLIAEVGNKKLFLSEISAFIPNDSESNDSIVMAEDYIKKWVRQKLVLQKAEENLPDDLMDVSRELEEYRNSLIIFRYKNELMAQRMDTTVSAEEINDYYLKYAGNFKLNSTIVKAIFIKIPAEYANPDILKEMSSNTTPEGISEMTDYCIQYAKGFDVITDRWVNFDRVMDNVPITVEDPERFLRNNQYVEHLDSNYYYLVTVHDYIIKNEQSPVEYVKEDIVNLILNRRKIDFLRNLENNIFEEGMNRKRFKIYNNKEVNEAL